MTSREIEKIVISNTMSARQKIVAIHTKQNEELEDKYISIQFHEDHLKENKEHYEQKHRQDLKEIREVWWTLKQSGIEDRFEKQSWWIAINNLAKRQGWDDKK